MSGLRPGEMRSSNARFTDTCPKCGQEIEERTFDQGNVWVHIKVSPFGHTEISQDCFAPEPEKVAKVGEMVHLLTFDNRNPTAPRPLAAIVTRVWPESPRSIEMTVFTDDGPKSRVSADRVVEGEEEYGRWQFTE